MKLSLMVVQLLLNKMTIGEVMQLKTSKQKMMGKMRQTIPKKKKRTTKKMQRKKARQMKMLKERTLRARVKAMKRMETKKVTRNKMLKTDSCTNLKFAWSNCI